MVSSTKFQIQGGGGCGYVNIFTTSSTVFVPSGSRPAVGLNAQVTGTGSCATSITATQVTLSSSPTTSIPKHVMTGAYLFSPDGPNGTTAHNRPFSAYASSLTWAETYSGSHVAATGIKTIFYTNPNRTEKSPPAHDPLYTSNENAFAHNCSGGRITQTGTTNVFYLMNPMSGALTDLYRSYVNTNFSQQHFDAVFDDEPFDWLALSAMPCNYNATTWMNAYINQIKALGRPLFYNGLGNLGANNSISPTIQLNAASIGGEGEGCYTEHWNPHYASGAYWVAVENTEIKMAQQNKIFICYANDLTSPASAIVSRTYNYASFLLTYNVNTTMLWEYYGGSSSYTVLPESKLVALSPAVATPSTVSSLRTSTGAYGRKYNACYIGGSAVGPCAVAVNSDAGSSHAFPFTGFHHTLHLSGGSVLDGGTISTQGAAPPSSMAPLTGVIAFQ